jgi:hypothetical protein
LLTMMWNIRFIVEDMDAAKKALEPLCLTCTSRCASRGHSNWDTTSSPTDGLVFSPMQLGPSGPHLEASELGTRSGVEILLMKCDILAVSQNIFKKREP